MKTDIDITLISGARPDMLGQTLRSFDEKIFRNFSIRHVFANIDLFMGTDNDRQECVRLIQTYFPEAKITLPGTAGFGKAVQTVWAQTSDRPVFHMEDDWQACVDIGPEYLDHFQDQELGMIVPMPRARRQDDTDYAYRKEKTTLFGKTLFMRQVNSYGTSPRFIRAGLAMRYADLMDPDLDPEKQVTKGINKKLCAAQKKFKVLRLWSEDGSAMFEDMGRSWLQSKGIVKNYDGARARWDNISDKKTSQTERPEKPAVILKAAGSGSHVLSCEKNIITTYRSWDLLPEPLKENFFAMKYLNPDWNMLFFDDSDVEDFISENYSKKTLAAYRSLNTKLGPARADFFRYLALYKIGGVYIDIKSKISKPLDTWLTQSDEFILAQWPPRWREIHPKIGHHPELAHVQGGEYINWFLRSRSGHPFLKELINVVEKNIRNYSPLTTGLGKKSVLINTGPIAYTRIIHKIMHLHPHVFERDLESRGIYYTFMKTTNDHKGVFINHYTTQKEPVVNVSKLHWLVFRLYKFAQRVYGFIKRLSKRISKKQTATEKDVG